MLTALLPDLPAPVSEVAERPVVATTSARVLWTSAHLDHLLSHPSWNSFAPDPASQAVPPPVRSLPNCARFSRRPPLIRAPAADPRLKQVRALEQELAGLMAHPNVNAPPSVDSIKPTWPCSAEPSTPGHIQPDQIQSRQFARAAWTSSDLPSDANVISSMYALPPSFRADPRGGVREGSESLLRTSGLGGKGILEPTRRMASNNRPASAFPRSSAYPYNLLI